MIQSRCRNDAASQVVSEVYSLHQVQVEPHVVLSLVLYKMVDANAEVREDALHMLQVLSMREWQTSATDLATAAGGALSRSHARMQEDASTAEAADGSDSVMVLGALQDSYQQFQYELAVSLARCALPPLFHLVCTPLCSKVLQHANPFCRPSRCAILACLAVVYLPPRQCMPLVTLLAYWTCALHRVAAA